MAKYFSGKTELFIKVCGPLWTSSEKKKKLRFFLWKHMQGIESYPQDTEDRTDLWIVDTLFTLKITVSWVWTWSRKCTIPTGFLLWVVLWFIRQNSWVKQRRPEGQGFVHRIRNSLLISIVWDSHQVWKSSYTSCQKIIFMEIWQLQTCQCKAVELLTHCLDRAH